RVGKAMGSEAKEYGVDILLAPALNIHRFPLGGRNYEYYSEDPLLSGKMAAAVVRGVQSQGVGTSIKHYVANNHEWNRNTINVRANERTLREIYLKGFEIAVKESTPWTIMSSYNKVNGTYTSESGELLSTVLRDQWGFDGFVMTDWFGGRDPVAQMVAGNDLLMPGTVGQQEALLAAVQAGQLDEAVLDRNLERLLTVMLESPVFKGYQYSDKPPLRDHADIARAAAAEGMILLRNRDGALPLPAGVKLALFGNSAYDMVTCGTGSGDVNEAYSISLQQGLEAAGFSTHGGLAKHYSDYLSAEKAKQPPRQPFMLPPRVPEREFALAEIEQAAAETDVALITLGRNSGEFVDREAENDFYLSQTEQALLREVSRVYHAQGKKVVAVLNIGGVIETASWRDQVDAIVLAWQPGQEAGHAVADVLSGAVNPSGKLATTFALTLDDYPAAENFPGVVLEEAAPHERSIVMGAKAAEVEYRDTIWVGYRAFNTDKRDTAYPFGFGLSYTRFEYGDVKLSGDRFEDQLSATVTVTNRGKTAGKEVVQLYIAAPEASLPKPESELRAFAKTRLLAPAESQTLSFTLTVTDLASFDPEAHQWVADAGQYTLKIGASSTDIRAQKHFSKARNTHLPLPVSRQP
ncbi:MAG: beta-glucosidase, partial [bacterium]|nr:beta-glucosidase [bacterium]